MVQGVTECDRAARNGSVTVGDNEVAGAPRNGDRGLRGNVLDRQVQLSLLEAGRRLRQASTDGNSATEEDPKWNPRPGICTATRVALCPVFGGTPEHTSGTSTFAGAASTILAGFYCTDRVSFSFEGEQSGSPARSYATFSEAAREAGRSRIYGGIHFQFSNDAGRKAGKEIGKEIIRTRLRETGTSGTCHRA